MAQKDTDDLTVFLCFWDLLALKLCIKMLVKLTPVFRGKQPEALKKNLMDAVACV